MTVLEGDCLEVLRGMPAQSVHCCVTSPPYFGLRDYGHTGQIGLEPTPEEFVGKLVEVFREVRHVLCDDGTLWLNLGDSYASKPNGSIGASTLDGGMSPHAEHRRAHSLRKTGLPPGAKHKDLLGIPWMVAFALRADGWYLRSDIIWHKPNPMPESVRDRPTSAHEHLFLLSKSERYYYDQDAVREPAAPSSVKRWQQDIDSQAGSDRANGGRKTNGRMKAVGGPRTTARDNFRRADSKRAAAHPGQSVGTHRPDREDTVPNPQGRNLRNVWTVATRPFSEAHFATFPPDLVEPCIKAGCPAGGVVLDPFGGAGTTGLVADRLQRDALLIELNPEYAALARRRINGDQPPLFAAVS